MQKYLKRAFAEIHLDRARRNVAKIKTLVDNDDGIMAVVKANAYGHDDITMAKFFESVGIKYFAVSNIHEAERLRNAGISAEILILGYVSPEYADELCENNIIATIVSKEHAVAMSDAAKQPLRCHIAIDTGMGRIGLRHKTAEEFADEVKEISLLKNISAEGIFTHLSVADSEDDDDVSFTESQRDELLAVNDCLKNIGVNLQHVHFLNSAGGTYYGDNRSTLARFGIMLYGLHPNIDLILPIKLEPVMDLKAEIACVKTVERGTFVSYGRTFKADKKMKIATITIGYADGYSRLLSGKTEVLIDGKPAKVIGKICMDQLMADVSEIENVKVGDIATLIGRDAEEEITADDLAKKYGTIGYEVVCGISKRIPRVVIDNGEILDVLEY
ncbi:MAG: alanine racemase [Oscillospiraceae bacterium]